MNPLRNKIARALMALAVIVGAPDSNGAQYTYDQLGRLVSAIEADGSTASYAYDANGNLTFITRTGAAPAVVVQSFTPDSGQPGTSVTIRGVGFGIVPAQNTVSFNGTPGTVVAANASSLTVIVPPGATTGSISVTSPSGSAVSSNPFHVTTVAISGFTPSRGVIGAAVTITGTGFNPVPASNVVKFNTAVATVTAATATELQVTVPAGAVSGRISVTNGAAEGVSRSDFFIPNGTNAGTDIVMVGRLTPGGAGLVYTLESNNKLGIATFDAVQGQRLTLVLTNRNLNGTYWIYAPDGSVVAATYLHANDVTDLPPLPATGTYSIVIKSANNEGAGSVSVRLATDASGTVPTTGTPYPVSLAMGQNADFTFSATAGQTFSLYLNPYSSLPVGGALDVSIVKADGTNVVACDRYFAPGNTSCRFATPDAGNYRLRINPTGSNTSRFTVRLNADFTAALSPPTPQAISLGSGQHARLTFTIASTQSMTLVLTDINMPPPAATGLYGVLYSAAGGSVAEISSGAANITRELPNLAAGTYSLVLQPSSADTTASMNVALLVNQTLPLSNDGTPLSHTTAALGQQATLTFAGTAGQNLGLAITGLAFAPGNGASYVIGRVYAPTGQEINFFTVSAGQDPGEGLKLDNLPQTGTYSVVLVPNGNVHMSFTAVLTVDVAGTLAVGSAFNLNLDKQGRVAKLTFTLGSTETLALFVDSISTTPARAVVVSVTNAAGASLGLASTAATNATINLPSLEAGTYTVTASINNAATGSMVLTLSPGLTGTLAMNTSSTFTTNVPGQIGYFTFSGTAGTQTDFAMTGLSQTPGRGSILIRVSQPNGAAYDLRWYSGGSPPGDYANFGPLPESGTYRVDVFPDGQASATYTLTPSTTVTDEVTLSVPQWVTLASPGQSAALTFTTPSSQSRVLSATSITTSPAGKYVSIQVLNATGAVVGGSGGYGATQTINLPNLASGNYTIKVVVGNAATAALQINVQ